MTRPNPCEFDTEDEYLNALDEFAAYMEAMEARAEAKEDCNQGWD